MFRRYFGCSGRGHWRNISPLSLTLFAFLPAPPTEELFVRPAFSRDSLFRCGGDAFSLLACQKGGLNSAPFSSCGAVHGALWTWVSLQSGLLAIGLIKLGLVIGNRRTFFKRDQVVLIGSGVCLSEGYLGELLFLKLVIILDRWKMLIDTNYVFFNKNFDF